MSDDPGMMSAWFAGPKGENSPLLGDWIKRIADDYAAWRRNYFPEDGIVVDSATRRQNEGFMDAFEDRLVELLARLKNDFPFHSPRYAAHMLAEQTLPSIAGYFAAMLYNPNNVTAEAAPVTVRLEIEAGRLLSKMIGYSDTAWAHLCSGGTAANIEALWVARSVAFLPWLVRDVRTTLSRPIPEALQSEGSMLAMEPMESLAAYAALWREIPDSADRAARLNDLARVITDSAFNVVERGVGDLVPRIGTSPVVLVPESHHYCFEKALDILGFGRRALVSVRVDERFRMRPDELERTLDQLERQGRRAIAVVAVAGSTEEGSVDPIDHIVRIRRERAAAGKPSFWLHADGAYGGYLRTVTIPERCGLGAPTATVRIDGTLREIDIALPEHQECAALEMMSHCDSVTIDPHKLGYIPYPAGAICFKSDLVKPMLRQAAPYLGDAAVDPETDRTSDSVGVYVLEGSKPGASAAAVWLSHSLIPLDTTGHGVLMRENIRNACELHALLEHYPSLITKDHAKSLGVQAVCICPPGSNIVCFAFRPALQGALLSTVNELNRAVYARFSLAAGERVYAQSFFISRTSLAPAQYSLETVGPFLSRLGVSPGDYADNGVFLLRSVLMNPWYASSKRRGRYYISELVAELYKVASAVAGASAEL